MAPLTAAFMPLVPLASSGPTRRIQPHVHPLVQVAAHLDVVVFQEDDALAELGLAGEVDHLTDEVLAFLVGGMRLAGVR